MLSPLHIALLVAGTMCLTVGLLELVVASGVHNPAIHYAFGLTALAAAANAFVEPLAYWPRDVVAYNAAMKLQISIQIAWWFLLVWFVVRYTGVARRWLVTVVLTGLSAATLIHLVSPYGLLFDDIQDLIVVRLPWGETISLAAGTPNPLRIIGDLTILALIALMIDTCLRMLRAGRRRQAILLGSSLAMLMVALVHGTLVDLLIVRSP